MTTQAASKSESEQIEKNCETMFLLNDYLTDATANVDIQHYYTNTPFDAGTRH